MTAVSPHTADPLPAGSVSCRIKGASQIIPGTAMACGVAACAFAIEAAFRVPVMISALLLGLLAYELPAGRVMRAGVNFSSRTLLRLGIALLGGSITLQQIASLGPSAAMIAICAVAVTLGCGLMCAKALNLDRQTGVIFGGAVAICGASAAMAISAAMPDTQRNRAATAVAVIGVTALSTIAMIAYPLVAAAFSLSDHEAGIFFGAAIHDVAQVVGAGYMVSDTAGEAATIVKLIRIACLVPVVAMVALLFSRQASSSPASSQLCTKRPALLPWFLAGFLALSAISSAGLLPAAVLQGTAICAKVLLVIAIAAMGAKTSMMQLFKIGPKPVLMLLLPTLVLAAFVLGVLKVMTISI